MSSWNDAVRLWRTSLIRIAGDEAGQDMIEYALLAAALAVIVAAAVPNQVVPVISTTFSKISASLNAS
jgi:Flp pilus assembly pilin Flp